jgi:hypothetical protein
MNDIDKWIAENLDAPVELYRPQAWKENISLFIGALPTSWTKGRQRDN